MKKIFNFIFSLSLVIGHWLLVITPQASALSSSLKSATSSPIPTIESASPWATPSDVIGKLKQIEAFKEKIATKVAELRDQEKTAVSGVINKIDRNKNTLIVSTKKGERTVTFSDDMTVFSVTNETKSEMAKSKLSQGQSIAVFGYDNEDKSILSAKYIYVNKQYTHIVGKIADIDKSNFTITIHSKEGNLVVDIESYTKTISYTVEKGKVKIGFSKLKTGDVAHIIAAPNSKEKDRYLASHILILPSVSSSTVAPTISQKESTPSATTSPKPSITPKSTRTPTPSKKPSVSATKS